MLTPQEQLQESGRISGQLTYTADESPLLVLRADDQVFGTGCVSLKSGDAADLAAFRLVAVAPLGDVVYVAAGTPDGFEGAGIPDWLAPHGIIEQQELGYRLDVFAIGTEVELPPTDDVSVSSHFARLVADARNGIPTSGGV